MNDRLAVATQAIPTALQIQMIDAKQKGFAAITAESISKIALEMADALIEKEKVTRPINGKAVESPLTQGY